MKIDPSKLTLEEAEIKTAIKEYIVKLGTVGRADDVTLSKQTYSGFTASVIVNTCQGIDPIVRKEADEYYKLRHKRTGLYFYACKTISNKSVSLLCNNHGNKWPTQKKVFDSISKGIISKKDTTALIEKLQEDLLEYELVKFGEAGIEDMTFHMDLLGKIE